MNRENVSVMFCSHLAQSAVCFGYTMASGCCGTKKQKLNNSSCVPSCNGTQMLTNGSNGMVALPDMCFFCFDVLYSHLYNLAPPKTPSFSNDA